MCAQTELAKIIIPADHKYISFCELAVRNQSTYTNQEKIYKRVWNKKSMVADFDNQI